MALIIDTLPGSLSNIECTGSSYRKNFTIHNGGMLLTEVFSLKLESNESCFKLFPYDNVYAPTASPYIWQTDIDLPPGAYLTFSVICENGPIGATASLIPVGTTIYASDGMTSIFSASAPLYFSVLNPEANTRRDIGSISAVDFTGEQIASQIDKQMTNESSFGVVRTNPKLTGNVKITVDSSNDIWLNSIDAVKELSDDRFKRYRLSPNSSYVIDIKTFFNAGTTPPELVYALYQADNEYTSTKRSLGDQFDRFYQYGVEALSSKFYSEDFSFFAPLYLKNDIPEYFVIFRTNGPVNHFTYDKPVSEWTSDFIQEILSNSLVVKTFSLKETSPIGIYLRNLINHPARKSAEMTVSFQRDGYTSFNGISYKEGSFAQKGELLYDYYQQENPIMSNEEFLTLGFERNGVVSSNLVNLEFLFDDEDADQYSINRYFGLYVNAIELANFELDENGFVQFSRMIGQTPIPRKGVDATKTSLNSFIQTNENGIRLYTNTKTIENDIDANDFTSLVTSISVGTTSSIFIPGNISNKILIGDECILIEPNDATLNIKISDVTYQDFNTILGTTSSIGAFSSSDRINFYSDQKLEDLKLESLSNRFIEGSGRLFYLKDREDFLHTVKSTEEVYASIDAFSVEKMIELKLIDKKVDITKFTGFLDIITQTPAVLLQKGKSSLSVDINNYFSPNDYIEIKWDNGPSTGGYPLRWRIIANNTSLLPGESWPSYGISSDLDGEYYFTFFNSGDSTVNLDVFVKSMEDAFNRFPFKNFEVLAKNSTIYFRSTQEGLSSEKAKLVFYNNSPSISVMGIAAPTCGIVSFIGASDRNKTRAKVDKNVANGMLLNEYISTEGNFSLPKQYKVFDQTIVSAPYLDEPVYDETGKNLINFIGAEYYQVILIENESQPIQLTYDKKLTSYELFRPSFGIISMYPLRDFDTDFHLSDYKRSYTPELIEYFGRDAQPYNVYSYPIGDPSPTSYIFEPGITFSDYSSPHFAPFLVLSDGSINSSLYTNIQFKFTSPGITATMVGTSDPLILNGTQVLLLPERKSLYYQEKELSKFKGFLSLSSIVSPVNEVAFQSMENLWDPKRFVFQNVNTEYDRLAENYIKSLCLKSRVVPYSLKWVNDNKDIRENKYRLNWNRAFGTMNFSPSLQNSADPKYHTHEWPYLDSVPSTYPITEYPDNSFSYMYEPLSNKYDFTSSKIDWFSIYFSTGYPTEEFKTNTGFEKSKVDNFEKYSYFRYEDFTNKIFTIFRGQKLELLTTTPQKYDGYKFSAIIKMENENFLVNEDPIKFNTLVNEKWKFIVVIITVRTSSYRFPDGKLSYADLYTLDNSNFIADVIGNLGLSTYNVILPNDFKLSDPINMSTFSGDIELASNIGFFDLFNYGNFQTDLTEELIEIEAGLYNRLCFCSTELSNQVSVSGASPSVNLIAKSNFHLSNLSGFAKYGGTNINTPVLSMLFPESTLEWVNFISYHEAGGNSSYLGFRDLLSFSEISKVLRNVSERIAMVYDIYDTNGVLTYTSTGICKDFTFSFISPETLIRTQDYIPLSDSVKPPSLFTYSDIGAVLSSVNSLQTLYRYQGNFSPKFRDVIKFWLREDDDFTISTSKDYLFCNTHFATEITDFMILKNQYYNKVSDSEILTISPNSGFTPVYPLVNEISIDKKDIFAWSSNWDYNYYRYYNNTVEYDEVRGTESMKEVKSLLGSKCMKVPKAFDLYQLTTEKITTNTDLSLSTKELAYKDYGTHCVIRVNIYDRLLREMFGTTTDLRAQTEFLKTYNIIPESFTFDTLSDKVKDYLIQNIMNLYEIQDVKLYILQTGVSDVGQISTTTTQMFRPVIETVSQIINNTTENVTLDENSLLSKDYIKKKDVKITTTDMMIFEINYPFDSRYFTSFSIGVSVKRI